MLNSDYYCSTLQMYNLVASSVQMTDEEVVRKILESIGEFSDPEIDLFRLCTSKKVMRKNEMLLKEGEICKSIYYILSGSFFQSQTNDNAETIIDLHTKDEWVFNLQSLVEQSVSGTTIKSFEKSELLELSLPTLHFLISKSQAFLKFASLLNQTGNRTHIFDNSLNPTERYDYIKKLSQNW